jgi:U3 small nucleolar RNA-associated protein 7
VWRDCLATKAASPYLTAAMPLGGIHSLRFCPYEDVLAAGCARGVSSLLIPGAGEPNFDSFVANPFASARERREAEVVALLDKLQPDTICLDPSVIGKVCARLDAQRARARGPRCLCGGSGAAGSLIWA